MVKRKSRYPTLTEVIYTRMLKAEREVLERMTETEGLDYMSDMVRKCIVEAAERRGLMKAGVPA